MLTQEQITHWKEEGYVIVPDFFSKKEVELMRNEMDSLCQQGHGYSPATDPDGKTHSKGAINFQIIPLNSKSELFKSVPYIPKVKNSLTGLLGPDIIHILDQIFLKPPGNGAATGWHTDNAYFNVPDPTGGTGLWVALHDANEENGTMRVIPKSHLQALPHVRDMSSDHHVTCATEIDPSQAVLAEVPAGGVVFFNFGVAHATGSNPTDKPRAGAAFHYATPEQTAKSSKSFQNGIHLFGSNTGPYKMKKYDENPNVNLWN